MKRLLWIVPLVGLVAAVVATPALVRGEAEAHGVTLGGVAWCGAGLCFTDVDRGAVHADRATLGVDRILRLRDVHVAASSGQGAATAAHVPDLPLQAVLVDGLVVDGLPLPPLRGQVWPHRHLEGEGVTVIGDTVDADVKTEFGELAARVSKDGDTLTVVADCDCAVKVPGFGDTALHPGPAHAEGTVADDTFEGTVTVGGVRADVEATRASGGDLSARFTLRDQPIAAIYGLFGPIVPETARARIRGTLSATGSVRWPDLDVTVTPTVADFAVDGLVDDAYRGGSFSYPVLDRAGNPTSRTTGDGDADWQILPMMGPYLPAAVIAAEDGRFYTHPGYDVEGMLAAADDNRKAGKIERGGSTLTQQLAKNLFLDGERTYARKLRELLYAVELERELGKGRILEVYLNVVEFGPGVYGAKQAAQAFFSKSPVGLLPEEAAFLASILRDPRTAWQTQYQRGTAHRARVDWILDNMRMDPDERAAAKLRDVVLVPGG